MRGLSLLLRAFLKRVTSSLNPLVIIKTFARLSDNIKFIIVYENSYSSKILEMILNKINRFEDLLNDR